MWGRNEALKQAKMAAKTALLVEELATVKEQLEEVTGARIREVAVLERQIDSLTASETEMQQALQKVSDALTLSLLREGFSLPVSALLP
jgi:prefoldin subunit 5